MWESACVYKVNCRYFFIFILSIFGGGGRWGKRGLQMACAAGGGGEAAKYCVYERESECV